MQLTTERHLFSLRREHRRRSHDILVLAGLGIVTALVFTLDRLTGLAHVQHLYYLPIIVAAIRFGMLGGASAAVLAILLYHLANPQALTWRYEESDILQIAVFM